MALNRGELINGVTSHIKAYPPIGDNGNGDGKLRQDGVYTIDYTHYPREIQFIPFESLTCASLRILAGLLIKELANFRIIPVEGRVGFLATEETQLRLGVGRNGTRGPRINPNREDGKISRYPEGGGVHQAHPMKAKAFYSHRTR